MGDGADAPPFGDYPPQARADTEPLRPTTDRFIIEGSTTGRFAVCHESWFHRRDEQREASRRMWEEFERTRPLSDPETTEKEHDVILEEPETPRLATTE
jgi:hypothetical protein